jgi:hypothetical protein
MRSDAMKSSIKTSLVKHKRPASLTKSTICTAVILSLVFTANSFAVLTTIFLDADTAATGSLLGSQPLVTPYGDITFVGEIVIGVYDPEFETAGASGNTFDILGPDDTPPGDRTAELFFDFDVISLEFIYGGNDGDINIEARDELGNMVDSFSQGSTGFLQSAGPITLSGSGIRSLYWTDTVPEQDYAPLDNITLTIPGPATIFLLGFGSLALFRRR